MNLAQLPKILSGRRDSDLVGDGWTVTFGSVVFLLVLMSRCVLACRTLRGQRPGPGLGGGQQSGANRFLTCRDSLLSAYRFLA